MYAKLSITFRVLVTAVKKANSTSHMCQDLQKMNFFLERRAFQPKLHYLKHKQ